MNRKQRRAAGIKTHEPVINIKKTDIEQIKKDVARETIDTAFILMMAIPTMVIHDKFGKLMKKEKREETFCDLCLDLYDSFEKGYVTLEDLQECLWEEAGVKLKR